MKAPLVHYFRLYTFSERGQIVYMKKIIVSKGKVCAVKVGECQTFDVKEQNREQISLY